MTTLSTSDAPLSPHWAFVVQLREGTALTPEALHGRVEHIVSGQAGLFTSIEELRAFMARVLATLPGARALARPGAHHDATAAVSLEAPVVRRAPRPHDVADMPRGIVPPQP
jgi:hypothetical protein